MWIAKVVVCQKPSRLSDGKCNLTPVLVGRDGALGHYTDIFQAGADRMSTMEDNVVSGAHQLFKNGWVEAGSTVYHSITNYYGQTLDSSSELANSSDPTDWFLSGLKIGMSAGDTALAIDGGLSAGGLVVKGTQLTWKLGGKVVDALGQIEFAGSAGGFTRLNTQLGAVGNDLTHVGPNLTLTTTADTSTAVSAGADDVAAGGGQIGRDLLNGESAASAAAGNESTAVSNGLNVEITGSGGVIADTTAPAASSNIFAAGANEASGAGWSAGNALNDGPSAAIAIANDSGAVGSGPVVPLLETNPVIASTNAGIAGENSVSGLLERVDAREANGSIVATSDVGALGGAIRVTGRGAQQGTIIEAIAPNNRGLQVIEAAGSNAPITATENIVKAEEEFAPFGNPSNEAEIEVAKLAATGGKEGVGNVGLANNLSTVKTAEIAANLVEEANLAPRDGLNLADTQVKVPVSEGIPPNTQFSSAKYKISVASDGRRVYRNVTDIDPGAPRFVSSSVNKSIRQKISDGWTNLDLMENGYAPIGPDGMQINLHHVLGQEAGPMVELQASTHQAFSSQLHGLIEDGASFRNDPLLNRQYNAFRSAWWTSRAADFY